jgi:hypothetical protein
MKYIVILVGIIAAIVYIFVSGPKGLASRAEAQVNRRQEVWVRIHQLEASRRDMLFRARMRMGRSAAPATRQARGRAWAKGYQAGFDQGYFEGSFLAENRKPDPMFFRVPNP